MTHILIEMSETEFDATYPLLPNHLNPHPSWAYGEGPGCLFETHCEVSEFVRRQNPQTIWTLIDGDDGDKYVVSGYHFVNRIGCLFSTKSVPKEIDVEVRIPMNVGPDSSAEVEHA